MRLWLTAVAVSFFVGCTGSGTAGVCEPCQDRANSCFELTPGLASLQGAGGPRELFQCFDADRNAIECVCCEDDGQPSCDPPLCAEELYCLADTNGVHRCWEESRPGLIDGVCTP